MKCSHAALEKHLSLDQMREHIECIKAAAEAEALRLIQPKEEIQYLLPCDLMTLDANPYFRKFLSPKQDPPQCTLTPKENTMNPVLELAQRILNLLNGVEVHLANSALNAAIEAVSHERFSGGSTCGADRPAPEKA